jgi:hypothetical protein
MEQREKLRFETNVPEVVALKFDDGLDVEGRYGDQVMYTLEDDRVMYVPPAVRSKIQKLGIQRGDEMTICKREVKSGNRRGIEWQVGRTTELEQELQNSIDHVKQQKAVPPQGNGNGTAPTGAPIQTQPIAQQPTTPKTKLEHALCTVVQACHSASEYSKQIGFQMPPADFEHISKMAMTLIIEQRNGGGR